MMKKSPFPGMDPYLERRWGDVHTRLCTYISGALQPNLPSGLRARAQEDVLLEDADRDLVSYYEPDIAIVESVGTSDSDEIGSVAMAARPLVVTFAPFPKRRRWVEIVDTSDDNRVVTAIEILSPGNKASSKLNRRYLEKLDEFLSAGVNVVEVDLLRSDRERLIVRENRIEERKRAAYYVVVCKAKNRNRWFVYPMPLRKPLSTVPIPCRETDADVPLEMQPIIDRIYLEGGHDDLDYSKPPEPPFSPEDAQWAAGLFERARGQS